MGTVQDLLKRETRQVIITGMKSTRFRERAHVVAHFAYRVPEDKRFTHEDVVEVFRALNLSTAESGADVLGLVKDGVLLSEYLSHPYNPALQQISSFPLPSVQGFFMERNARFAHQERLQRSGVSPEPELQSVSETLQQLAAKVSDRNERVFLDETLLCLKAQACRAAIVMGWNLAFDHFRRFVVAHKLCDFNAVLTTKTRPKSTAKYDAVKAIEEFPDGERFFIDICRVGNILTKDQSDILIAALGDRNKFAHPSSIEAGPAMAAGYVDRLVRNVVTNRAFEI